MPWNQNSRSFKFYLKEHQCTNNEIAKPLSSKFLYQISREKLELRPGFEPRRFGTGIAFWHTAIFALLGQTRFFNLIFYFMVKSTLRCHGYCWRGSFECDIHALIFTLWAGSWVARMGFSNHRSITDLRLTDHRNSVQRFCISSQPTIRFKFCGCELVKFSQNEWHENETIGWEIWKECKKGGGLSHGEF